MRQRRHLWDWSPKGGTCRRCGAHAGQIKRQAKDDPGRQVWVEVYVAPDGTSTERRVPPCEPKVTR